MIQFKTLNITTTEHQISREKVNPNQNSESIINKWYQQIFRGMIVSKKHQNDKIIINNDYCNNMEMEESIITSILLIKNEY